MKDKKGGYPHSPHHNNKTSSKDSPSSQLVPPRENCADSYELMKCQSARRREGLERLWQESSCRLTLHRSEEHTSELQSRPHLVCRLLLGKKKKKDKRQTDSS